MASVAEDVSHILMVLRSLEERMKALRLLIEPVKKERKPNQWILFNKRIDALMKENNTPFASVSESKKFAAALKNQKGYDWADEDIMTERTESLMETLKACPICEENPHENVADHRDCIVKFATQEGPLKNPVGAWMRASSTLRATTTTVKVVNEVVNEVSLPGTL